MIQNTSEKGNGNEISQNHQRKMNIHKEGIRHKRKKIGFIEPKDISNVFTLQLSPTEKIILLMVVCFSKYGEYNFSQSLQEYSGCKKSTVKKCLASLVKGGYLERFQRGIYLLNLPPAEADSKSNWVNLNIFRECLHHQLHYTQKIVLLTIVKYISKGRDTCYPKLGTVANLTGLAADTVSEKLSELVDLGLIQRFKQGKRWVVRYTPGELEGHEILDKVYVSSTFKAISGDVCKNPLNKYKKDNVFNGQSLSLQKNNSSTSLTATAKTSSSLLKRQREEKDTPFHLLPKIDKKISSVEELKKKFGIGEYDESF